MSKIKFKLVPDPTFEWPVPIPVAGAKPVPVTFIFKHRDRDAYKAFIENLSEMDDETIIQSLAVGWELEDEFNDENISKLLKNYHGAARAVLNEYINEQGALRDAVLGK